MKFTDAFLYIANTLICYYDVKFADNLFIAFIIIRVPVIKRFSLILLLIRMSYILINLLKYIKRFIKIYKVYEDV